MGGTLVLLPESFDAFADDVGVAGDVGDALAFGAAAGLVEEVVPGAELQDGEDEGAEGDPAGGEPGEADGAWFRA